MAGVVRPKGVMLAEEVPVVENDSFMYNALTYKSQLLDIDATYAHAPSPYYGTWYGGSNNYVDVTVPTAFNLWTSVHTSYTLSSQLAPMSISLWNGSTFVLQKQYIETVPSHPLVKLPTATDPVWFRSFTNIPAGRYRFVPYCLAQTAASPTRAFGAWFFEKYTDDYFLIRKEDGTVWVYDDTLWTQITTGNPTDLQFVVYGMRRIPTANELNKLDNTMLNVEVLKYTQPSPTVDVLTMDTTTKPNMCSTVIDLTTLGCVKSVEVVPV